MRIAIDYGRQRLEVEASPGQRIVSLHGPARLADPAAAVRAALEVPFAYPPLRRALTPDDHIVVVVDEQLPDLATLLIPLLEHVGSAGIEPEAITLLCPTSSTSPAWIDQLPDELDSVRVEVHDAKDRRRLSYLATTAAGRRLDLNRTLIDADQVIVLTGRRYDPYLGYGGAEGALFPALADEKTREDALRHPHLEAPGRKPWPLRQEAIEVAYLLGQPFYVQVIASEGDGVAHVIAGAGEASREAERQLDAGWRPHVASRPDTVIATLSGDPARHTFADLAGAVSAAARIVQPKGRIILLTDAPAVLAPATEVLLEADEPQTALAALKNVPAADRMPLWQWAQAAGHARLSILGNLPDETVEELFASPLADAAQVQRLVAAGGACLVLRDAQRMMPVVDA
jgi:nickel-dependent lactate racemase